jgi:hypothetical protein
MTAHPQDFAGAGAAMPDKNLRAIRAALVVSEDRDAFDAGLRAVLDEVRVGLDLGALNAFVHRWWISACDSVNDPEGRRQMHAQAGRIRSGEQTPHGRPWREVIAGREDR